ncbi:SCO2400 family protein [Streptomyces zaehneri]
MDYCHPCRRHLNGALACPGCGAPAQRLRAYPSDASGPEPSARDTSAHRTPGAPDGRGDPDDHGAHDGRDDHGAHDGRDDHGAREDRDEHDGHADHEDGSGEPQGRAARRRGQGRGGRRGPQGAAVAPEASRRDRKASAHRRRRKRIVLITVGFALAAGGLSLAELGVDAPGFTSPGNPAAAGGEASEVDGSSEPSASAPPLDDRTDTGGDEASNSPSPSASPSASESAKDASATPSPDKDAQSATLPGSAGSTSGSTPSDADSGSDPTPTADPSAPAESPDPSPSQTCTRFLWWCS